MYNIIYKDHKTVTSFELSEIRRRYAYTKRTRLHTGFLQLIVYDCSMFISSMES